MLICDNSTINRVYQTRISSMLIIIALSNILASYSLPSLPKFRLIGIIFIGIYNAIMLFILGYTYLQVYLNSKRKIIDDISCGEIVRLITYLDRIVNIFKPKEQFFNPKRIEKILDKLADIHPNIAVPIRVILKKNRVFEETKKLYELQKRMEILAITMLLIVLLYALLSIIYSLELTSSLMPILILFAIETVIMIIFFTKRDRIIRELSNINIANELKESLNKLIDLVSRHIEEPIAMLLLGSYPKTTKKAKYVMINPSAYTVGGKQE